MEEVKTHKIQSFLALKYKSIIYKLNFFQWAYDEIQVLFEATQPLIVEEDYKSLNLESKLTNMIDAKKCETFARN